MTNPTHAPADMLDAKALEDVARAIYGVMPNYGVEWRPNTNGGSSQVRVDDPWEDAPDRHADCLAQAEAAIRAYRAALPAGNEPVAWLWRMKIGGQWCGWATSDMDPNDWTWRDDWQDLQVRPLYASPLTLAEWRPVAWQSDKLGAWLSAALDDPSVADEYKQAINDWFAAGQPVAPLDWRSFLRLIDKHQYAFERVPAAWNAFVKLRNEVCALTPAEGETAAREPVEMGWLIEQQSKSGPPTWWCMGDATSDGGYFTADSKSALRFARSEDAQAYIDDIGWTECVPTEHMWGGNRLASRPTPSEEKGK